MREAQRDKFSAILDPDQKFVTLVVLGENGAFHKLPTKVKIIASDNSMLSTSNLDVSKDQSFDDGGIIDLRRKSWLFGATEQSSPVDTRRDSD